MTPRVQNIVLGLMLLAIAAIGLLIAANLHHWLRDPIVDELRFEPHDCTVVERDDVGRAVEFECRPVTP